MKNSYLIPIFLIVSVDILGLAIVLPLLPFYAEKYGATPTTVGLLVTIYAACQFLAGPLLGQISDRIGRKPLLLVSQFGTLVGFLIFAYANSLWLIFLSRFIDGITAGNLSIAQAYISDVTEPKDRAKSFGLIGLAFGVGFLIGPAISGYLSQFGYQYPIFAAAGLSATSILTTYFLLPSRTGNVPVSNGTLKILDLRGYIKLFRRPELSNVLWQFLLFAFAFSTFVSGFALFAERRYTHHHLPYGPREVGYVFAYAGLVGLILQGSLIGKLVSRFGELKLISAGFLVAAIGYTVMGFTFHVPFLLVAVTFASLGNGVVRPCLMSLVSQRSARNEQGVVLGTTQSLNSLAQVIAPVVGGVLIDLQWLGVWAMFAAVCMTLGFTLNKAHTAHRQQEGA